MKFTMVFSLILSHVRAFVYTTPKVTGITESRIQGMPRCKSTESIVRLEEMEECTLDSPKESMRKRIGDIPINPHVEFLLEATPLVLLGILASIYNN